MWPIDFRFDQISRFSCLDETLSLSVRGIFEERISIIRITKVLESRNLENPLRNKMKRTVIAVASAPQLSAVTFRGGVAVRFFAG